MTPFMIMCRKIVVDLRVPHNFASPVQGNVQVSMKILAFFGSRQLEAIDIATNMLSCNE